jgi:low temperature requirement protein LtrA
VTAGPVAKVVAVPTEPTEKRVSWAELFFDLVFVFAVTEVSALLTSDHSWAGTGRALVVFVPIYWAWVGTSIQANVHDMTRPLGHLAIFTVALSGLVMALCVTQAYGDRGLLFACAYWAARLSLGVRLFASGLVLNPYTVSMFGTGPLLVAGALLPSGPREAVWLVAALADLSSPTLLRSRLRGMHFDAGHLTERFGLFVLIALGESVVRIGEPAATSDRLGVAAVAAVVAAFVVTCGLWWVYFFYAADAMRFALATAAVQLSVTRHVLSYGHLCFIAAVIAVAVGMTETIAHPGRQLEWGTVALLYGGTALYLATFGYTRWMMFRLFSSTRVIGAVVVLAALPLARQVPALAATTLLAVLLVGLNRVEYLRVRRASTPSG